MSELLTPNEYKAYLTIAGFAPNNVVFELKEYTNREISKKYGGGLYDKHTDKLSNIKTKLASLGLIHYKKSKKRADNRGRMSEMRYASLRTDRNAIKGFLLELIRHNDINRIYDFSKFHSDLIDPILADFLSIIYQNDNGSLAVLMKGKIKAKLDECLETHLNLFTKFLKYEAGFKATNLELTEINSKFCMADFSVLIDALSDESLSQFHEELLQTSKKLLTSAQRKKFAAMLKYFSRVYTPAKPEASDAISFSSAHAPQNLTISKDDLALDYLNNSQQEVNYDIGD